MIDKLIPGLKALGYSSVSFLCFWMLSKIDKPDSSMEVGIGIVGICGFVCAVGGLISIGAYFLNKKQ